MDQSGTDPAEPTRSHLRASEDVSPAGTSDDADLTRHRGQGNGVRAHGILFAAAALAALVLVVLAVILATTMM